MADTPNQLSFFDAFARPAWVVMMAAQMLLGLALAIVLIMKYYMLASACLVAALLNYLWLTLVVVDLVYLAGVVLAWWTSRKHKTT